jgi:hypothetical protein
VGFGEHSVAEFSPCFDALFAIFNKIYTSVLPKLINRKKLVSHSRIDQNIINFGQN